MRTVYALVWKSFQEDKDFNQGEFESRIPRIMDWLRDLRTKGQLRACGGGGWVNHSGGLTIVEIEAESEDEAVLEAVEIAKKHPLNEIGETSVMVWDLFFADLNEKWSANGE